jgi:hypothetical protein
MVEGSGFHIRKWTVSLRGGGDPVPIGKAEVEAAWLDTANACLTFCDSEGCVVRAYAPGAWLTVSEVGRVSG